MNQAVESFFRLMDACQLFMVNGCRRGHGFVVVNGSVDRDESTFGSKHAASHADAHRERERERERERGMHARQHPFMEVQEEDRKVSPRVIREEEAKESLTPSTTGGFCFHLFLAFVTSRALSLSLSVPLPPLALVLMTTILRTPALFLHPPAEVAARAALPAAPRGPPYFCARRRISWSLKLQLSPLAYRRLCFPKFKIFAAYGDTTEAEEIAEAVEKDDSDEETSLEDGATDGGIIDTEETVSSTVLLSLQSYKEALANNDQTKVAEIESFLQSIEDEKNSLSSKVAALAEELSTEQDRILRISADFDNFRKRTERERLSLMMNVQGEVIESLLPVLDNFERAKTQIKVETEGEEKINNSYQSIYKQFLEILTSLGVETVETVGSTFDPMLHEAIMREESMEFEEGIIIQEFRKGFKLGERLLRPSMVKVSAGPGPQKAVDENTVVEDGEASESSEEGGDSE